MFESLVPHSAFNFLAFIFIVLLVVLSVYDPINIITILIIFLMCVVVVAAVGEEEAFENRILDAVLTSHQEGRSFYVIGLAKAPTEREIETFLGKALRRHRFLLDKLSCRRVEPRTLSSSAYELNISWYRSQPLLCD